MRSGSRIARDVNRRLATRPRVVIACISLALTLGCSARRQAEAVRAPALLQRGLTAAARGDIAGAISNYDAAAAAGAREADTYARATAISQAGHLLAGVGRFQEAKARLQEAGKLYEATGHRWEHWFTEIDLALAYEELGDLVAARATAHRALEQSLALPESPDLGLFTPQIRSTIGGAGIVEEQATRDLAEGLSRARRGSIAAKSGDSDLAASEYREASRCFLKIGALHLALRAYIHGGQAALAKGVIAGPPRPDIEIVNDIVIASDTVEDRTQAEVFRDLLLIGDRRDESDYQALVRRAVAVNAAGAPLLAANVYRRIAQQHEMRLRFEEAGDLYAKALHAIDRTDVPTLKVLLLREVAGIDELSGDVEVAIGNLSEALAIATSARNPAQQAALLMELGRVYEAAGIYEVAVRSYRGAADSYQSAGLPVLEATAMAAVAGAGLHNVQFEGNYDASADLQRAIDLLYAVERDNGLTWRDTHEAMVSEFKDATRTRQEGEPFILHVAMIGNEAYQKWRARVPLLDDQYLKAWAETYRVGADIEARNHKYEDAGGFAVLALTFHAALPPGREKLRALLQDAYLLGRILQSAGRPDEAEVLFGDIVAIGDALGSPESHYGYLGLADLIREKGQLAESEAFYDHALRLWSASRLRVQTDTFRAANLSRVYLSYSAYVTALLAEYQATGEVRLRDKALQVAEQLRARSLVEQIGTDSRSKAGGHSARAREVRSLRLRLATLQSQLASYSGGTGDTPGRKNEVTATKAELENVAQQLDALKPPNALEEQPVSQPSEIQQGLPADTAVLYYVAAEPAELWLIVISQKQANVIRLEVADATDRFLDMLKALREPGFTSDDTARFTALASEAYDRLVRPAEPFLDGVEHLVVVPDGLVSYLPFEAFTNTPIGPSVPPPPTTYAKLPFLVRKYRISYAHSLSVIAALAHAKDRPAPPLPLFALGDPRFADEEPIAVTVGIDAASLRRASLRGNRISALPYSRKEVESVADEWGVPSNSTHVKLGANASRKGVASTNLSRYRVIHFATHAVAPNDVNLISQPALLLSGGPGGVPDAWTLSDIQQKPLNADLVILSACNTGTGGVMLGEGFMSLSRAFLAAGARATVMSLWKVEDQATALLMQRFHRNLRHGVEPAEALRRAKLDVIETTTELTAIGSRMSLASPFFWAGFVMIGDPMLN